LPRTLIEIDRSSAEPLYRQVRRAIEHGIASGVFDVHHRLPSSRELAIDLAVSRNTINLAYQELIAEGFVRSHERSGMFVNPEMLEAAAAETRATVPRIDWASRIRRQPDAGIPEIEKTSDWYRYPYPFLAGQIDIRSFPARAWVRCLRDALYQPHAYPSLQDSVAADDPMLIDMIRQQLLPPRGIEAGPDEILVTVGSQQGLDLVGRLLLGPGHRVAIENPGYLDARHIFVRTGATVSGIDVDEHGLHPPDTLAGTHLLYLTPSHHHPTNVTLGIDRRRSLGQSSSRTTTTASSVITAARALRSNLSTPAETPSISARSRSFSPQDSGWGISSGHPTWCANCAMYGGTCCAIHPGTRSGHLPCSSTAATTTARCATTGPR
jgi:GntR family transcriptional regulator / MocR family aminotransferase